MRQRGYNRIALERGIDVAIRVLALVTLGDKTQQTYIESVKRLIENIYGDRFELLHKSGIKPFAQYIILFFMKHTETLSVVLAKFALRLK